LKRIRQFPDEQTMRSNFNPACALAFSVLVFSVLATLPRPCAAEVPKDAADYIEYAIARGQLVGVVVGYIDGNETTIRGFGVASKETAKAPDANTIFEIGSITKTFTGTLLAQEVLDGRMNLSDAAQKFLPPDITARQIGTRPVSLEDLATHYSGLPRMPANFAPANPADPYAAYGVDWLWDSLNAAIPARAAGVGYEYSNFGYAVLGQLIARRAGVSYPELVSRSIFKPLQMTSSAVGLADTLRPRAAQGYGTNGAPTPHWTLGGFTAAGAINSNATDMLAWIRANMAARRDDARNGLDRAMKLAQQARANIAPDGSLRIGLGWMTTPTRDGHWHNGGTGGFASFAGFTDDGRRAVVLLSNKGGQTVDALGLHLLNPASPLPEVLREVTLAPGALDEYIGRYALTPQAAFTVARDGTSISATLPGQNPTSLLAYQPDRFFAKGVDAQVSFERRDGRVVALTLHQGGQHLRARRLGSDGQPIDQPGELQLSPEELDAYVGRYQLNPQQVCTITRDGTRLSVQVGRQPRLPIYAEGPDNFSYRVIEARIEFERDAQGAVTALTFRQNGGALRAPRIGSVPTSGQ
jgi:serine-type D-Ala-D-Ala carboxypeptidase/endopeptidase